MSSGLHERFDRDDHGQASSERGFGLVMAAAFAVLASIVIYHHAGLTRAGEVLLAIALAFLALALTRPAWLAPLNRVWFRFSILLYRLTNPVLMLLIYSVAMVPMGLLLKLCGKDPLHRRFDAKAESYWIARTPPGPKPDTMKHQF